MDTKTLERLERIVINRSGWVELFNAYFDILTSFICFQSDEEPIVITNWIVSTYLAQEFSYAGYLHIFSATERCGKSKSIEVIECLVHEPLNTANISDSALFRSLDNEGGVTLILDEIDKLDKQAKSEQIGILNSGYSKRGAQVTRTEGTNGNFTVKRYSAYGPKLFSGIGQDNLGNTLRDRSFPIELKRMLPSERVERLIYTSQFEMLDNWKTKLQQLTEELKKAEEKVFSDFVIEEVIAVLSKLNSDDRAIDISHPLVAISLLGDMDWVTKTINAVNTLTGKKTEEVSWEIELLMISREIAKTDKNKGIYSNDLADALNNWSESRFSSFNNGNGINKNGVARALKGFGVNSRQLRMNGENRRGYHWDDFQDAFARWLPQVEVEVSEEEKVEEVSPF